MRLLPHLVSPQKRADGFRRRLAVLGTAALLLGALFFGVRSLTGPSSGGSEALALPGGERTRYELHLRYTAGEETLTVTEDIRWTNTEPAEISRMCLRVAAKAYERENTSPAAAADVWERGYPHGFDEAALIQEGCWVDDELIRPLPDPEQPVLMWLDRPVAAGETVSVKLRYRLKLPDCAGLFGRAGGVVRLMQALPVMAARLDESWDAAGLAAYGDPQETGLSDVQVTAELPQGYRLVTGPEAGVNQLSLLIVPDGLARADAEISGTGFTVLAGTKGRADAILSAAKRVWPVYARLYGSLPLKRLTVVSLPLTDSGFSAPGVVLIDDALSDAELEHRLAYWLAGQWFGWALGADRARDAWFICAARQWAALRYVRATAGADAEADLRRLWVDLPMREDLHAAVTPGTPPDGFPDLATYRAVLDGRAAAFLYALDTWTDGGFDALLGRFVRQNAFTRVDREALLQAVYAASGRDASPLMADWLDTYIMETP